LDDKIIIYIFHTYGGLFCAKELYIFGGVKLDSYKRRTRVKYISFVGAALENKETIFVHIQGNKISRFVEKTFGLTTILQLLKRQNGPWTQDERKEAERLKREDRADNNVTSSRKLNNLII
jgi:hypothetical protein